MNGVPKRRTRTNVRFEPATASRWADVAALFGERGACGGCWCMWPRLRAAEYARGRGESNRRALRSRMRREAPPGVIAYEGGTPVAWAAIAPREEYARFEASRVLAPVDDAPVWSIPCLFVARTRRGRGLTAQLIEAACRHAARHGARVIEGYPLDIGDRRQAAAFGWVGYLAAFEAAGFREVLRRSPTRPIVRRTLRPWRKPAAPIRRAPATRRGRTQVTATAALRRVPRASRAPREGARPRG